MRRSGFTIIELVIVLAVMVGLIGFFVIWHQTADSPVPIEPPDESRRQSGPDGLSMVVPPNWSARAAGDDVWMIVQNPSHGRQGRACIFVIPQDGPPYDLNDYKKVTLHGEPAYEKRESGLGGRYSDFVLAFERNAEWYHVLVSIRGEHAELPPMIRRYLETLRFPEG